MRLFNLQKPHFGASHLFCYPHPLDPPLPKGEGGNFCKRGFASLLLSENNWVFKRGLKPPLLPILPLPLAREGDKGDGVNKVLLNQV